MLSETTELSVTKGAAVLGSAVLSVLFCVLPWKILNAITHAYYSYGKESKSESERYQKKWSLIQCALTCFTGGIFLGTCMLSMFPEIQVHSRCFKRLLEARHVDDRLTNYPWPEFSASLGFFFIFFLEEVTLYLLKQRKAASAHRTRTTSDSVCDGPEAIAMLRQQSDVRSKRQMSKVSQAVSQCGDLVEPPWRPHPHNHVVRSIVLLMTLSFHTIIESMNYALHRSAFAVWTLFWTTNIHQAFVAFALGTQLARTHRRNVAFIIVCVCLYSLSTPIGFLSGLALAQVEQQLLTEETIVMILEGFAVGAFLYVTFYEVLSHELNNEHSSFMKLFTIFLGVAVIAGLSFFGQKNERFGEEVH